MVFMMRPGSGAAGVRAGNNGKEERSRKEGGRRDAGMGAGDVEEERRSREWCGEFGRGMFTCF